MIKKLQEIINNSSSIVFFTGAGISTESGIPDFRSSGGLYSTKGKYRAEEIISNSFFNTNPDDFYKFYKDKMIYKNALPNSGHKKIAKLENLGKVKAVITQNIDNLHQLAGSKKVIELHGSVYRNYCIKCNKSYNIDYILENEIPYCNCGEIVKPDVVLYEEQLDNNIINSAIKAIENCNTLIVCGTSLTVYPAASFVGFFRGENLIIINKDSTQYDNRATLVINDSIGKVLSEVISDN